jgi:hypothetical protein
MQKYAQEQKFNADKSCSNVVDFLKHLNVSVIYINLCVDIGMYCGRQLVP